MKSYQTITTTLAGLVLAGAIGCSSISQIKEPEPVTDYQRGKTQFAIFGKGQRDNQSGMHPVQLVRYQTTNSEGQPSEIEISCQTNANVRNKVTGKLEYQLYVPTQMTIDGNVAMHRPLLDENPRPGVRGEQYYGAPQAKGAYNASTLEEVAVDVCKTAGNEAFAFNKNNAEKLKADQEKQARENTNKAKPQ